MVRMPAQLRTPGLRDLPANQRVLLGAQTVETFATFGIQTATLLWAAGLPAAPRVVTAVVVITAAARLLGAPLVGRVLARWSEVTTMSVANLVRSAVCLATAGVAAGGSEVPVILTVTGLVALLDQFFVPARTALTQRNVPPRLRVLTASLSFFTVSGIALVAAAVVPPGFVRWRWRGCTFLAAGLFLTSALVLSTGYRKGRESQADPPADTVSPRFLPALRNAFSAGTRQSVVTWTAVGLSFGMGMTSQGLALLSLRVLRVPVALYGWLTGAFAAGGLAAFLLTGPLTRRWPTVPVMLAAVTATGVGYAVLGSLSGWEPGAAVMFLIGLGFGLYSSLQGAVVQHVVPNDRIAGFLAALAFGTVSATILGALAADVTQRLWHHAPAGYRSTFWLAAAVITLSGAVRARAAAAHPPTG